MALIQVNLFEVKENGMPETLNKDDVESNSSMSVLHPEYITKEYVLNEEDEKLARI
jgi:hypothetical protein